MIEYRKWITRQMLRDERDKLFVFGDNVERVGYGGQAREMRGEPNAVGIPTKWRPSMDADDFFSDDDFDRIELIIGGEVMKLIGFQGTIVWPADGIGTGLAQLPTRAPKVWAYLEKIRLMLENPVDNQSG